MRPGLVVGEVAAGEQPGAAAGVPMVLTVEGEGAVERRKEKRGG